MWKFLKSMKKMKKTKTVESIAEKTKTGFDQQVDDFIEEIEMGFYEECAERAKELLRLPLDDFSKQRVLAQGTYLSFATH
jgi:hypothetical protein